MSKREKIILIIMIVAILVGLFEFLFSSSPDPDMMVNKKKLEEIKSSLSSSALVLSSGNLSDNQLYIMSIAAENWAKNPFKDMFSNDVLSRNKNYSTKERSENKKSIQELIYSGFLSMAKKRMAIINGIEYEEGDELETRDYVVKQIKPSEVLLKMKNQDKTISITLSE
jgi:hypothetical protein